MSKQINDLNSSTQQLYYNNKPYKPLSKTRLVLNIIGTSAGGINAILTILLLFILFTNPYHPGFLMEASGGFVFLCSLVTGIISIVFLSICLPKLIFKSRKTPPKRKKYILTNILLPCGLTVLFIAGIIVAANGYSNYDYPTFSYKGAVFEYYEDYNEDGSNGLFREGTVIVGLADDSPVPESLEIPAEINGHSVHKIYKDAFKDNTEITEVVFPDDITFYIEDSAFEGCSSLKRVVFGHWAEFEHRAFKDCTSLTEIAMHKGNGFFGSFIYEDDTFEGCPNAESLKAQLEEEY